MRLLFLLLLATGFAWYVFNSWDDFQELKISQPILLFPTIVVAIANIYSLGMLLELTLRPHGVVLSKWQVLGLASLTRFGNYISPGYLGLAIRAVYLKKKYNVDYTKFSSSFIVSNLLQLLISGFIIIGIYIFRQTDSQDLQSIVYIIGLFIVFLIVLFLPLSWMRGILNIFKANKLINRVDNLLTQYHKVRTHPGLFSSMLIWMLITLTTSSTMLYFLYPVIGFHIGILPAIFIATIGGWAIIFSITPASIGVREGLMALGAQIMGVSIPATLAAAILLRLVVFFIVSVLSAYYAPRLLNVNLSSIRDVG